MPGNRIGRDYPVVTATLERDALRRDVEQAERAGAVELRRGRGGASHLIQRVYLLDAGKLYDFAGIVPAAQARSERLASFLGGVAPATPEGQAAADLLGEHLAEGRKPYGIDEGDIGTMRDLVAAVDAIHAREDDDRRDIRALSVEALGNSKTMGRIWGKVCRMLRELGLAGADEDDGEIQARYDIHRHIPLVTMAGPLRSRSVDVGLLSCAGLPETEVAALEPYGEVTGVLTVENWESFARHVAERRRRGEIVVYTGGWPSRGVLRLLDKVAPLAVPKFHWGDVDPAGVRIAHAVSARLGGARPHLMDAALAESRGEVPRERHRPPTLPEGSPFRPLAEYLAMPDARYLEQEAVPPQALPEE